MSHFYKKVELVSKGKIMRFEMFFQLYKITTIRKWQFGRTNLGKMFGIISSYIMLNLVVRVAVQVVHFSTL